MNVYIMRHESGKIEAVIVDMDGTLVDVSTLRHLIPDMTNPDGTYKAPDFDYFHEEAVDCPAIWDTVDSVMNWWTTGRDILIVTARSDKYRRQTERWLKAYRIPYSGLFMRSEGDLRSDYEVKKDLFSQVQKDWHVAYAIDDNPSIIDLWNDLGIPCRKIPGWVEEIA